MKIQNWENQIEKVHNGKLKDIHTRKMENNLKHIQKTEKKAVHLIIQVKDPYNVNQLNFSS